MYRIPQLSMLKEKNQLLRFRASIIKSNGYFGMEDKIVGLLMYNVLGYY